VVNWSESSAVVIPCLNEGGTIALLVGEARQQFPIVIVVDDGSTDGTGAQAAQAGAKVIRHEQNAGKGAALRTGLRAALAQGCEWAVTLDGDGQHRAEDIPLFLRRAEETGAALVIGNRMHQAHAIPWLRRAVNRWMSRQLSRRAGRSLPDTQCGFRLLNLHAWAKLPLKTEHYEVESETLLAFLTAGHAVEFVPIQVIGQAAHSHIRPIADSLRWWRWWRGAS
jgi:glycosyltransferase involved in cell wall biosynthesis